MVIAGFDDQRDVHRIGLETGAVGGLVIRVHLAAICARPIRHMIQRRLEVIDQRGDLLGEARPRKPAIWVDAALAITWSVPFSRPSVSGISAGPVPPRRSAPWHEQRNSSA